MLYNIMARTLLVRSMTPVAEKDQDSQSNDNSYTIMPVGDRDALLKIFLEGSALTSCTTSHIPK